MPTPSITTISPISGLAGDANIVITVNGANFAAGRSQVLWTNGTNTTPLTTTFVSAAQLTATVPQNLVTSTAVAGITVQDSGGPTSNSVNFTVLAPLIASLAPNSGTAGAVNIPLTVNGSHFVSNASPPGTSTIFFSAAAQTTTFANTTKLQTTLASLPASAGPYSVQVQNPGGTTSTPSTFTVLAAPTVIDTVPTSRTVNTAGFSLVVDGANYIAGDVVLWDSTQLSTVVTSATKLTATVPAGLLTTAASHQISVLTPDGVVSNAVAFQVTAVPTIGSLNPQSITATAPGFTLTVNGSNFLNNMTVVWNGQNLATTFVSANKLTAPVSAALVTSSGFINVTVVTADGVNSSPSVFTINAAPSITTLTPNALTATHAGFTLTVDGKQFRQRHDRALERAEPDHYIHRRQPSDRCDPRV